MKRKNVISRVTPVTATPEALIAMAHHKLSAAFTFAISHQEEVWKQGISMASMQLFLKYQFWE